MRNKNLHSGHIDQVVRVANTYVADHDPEQLHWSWGEALLMYSLSLLDDALDQRDYFPFYQAYVDHHHKVGFVVDQSDTCAPVLVSNELYKKTGKRSI